MTASQKIDQKIRHNKKKFLEYAKLVEDAKPEANLVIGGKKMPCLLRPYFLSKNKVKSLKQDIKTLFNSLDKILNEYPKNKNIREVIALSKTEEELALIDPGFRRKHVLVARPDCFFIDNNNFKITEFNADSPAGSNYSHAFYNQILKTMEPMRSWLNSIGATYDNMLVKMEKIINKTWYAFSGKKNKPAIAWVEWSDAKCWSDIYIEMEYFKKRGYKCISAEPQELKYKNGRLYKNGFKIDLIRKRAVTSEIAQRMDKARDLVQAVQNKKVCLINPLRSKVVADKTTMHILTHPDFAYLFNNKQLKIIQKHVPVTRLFRKIKDDFGKYGQVNLVSFAKSNKNKLVLKPRNLYGGKKVHLGKLCSQNEWNKAVRLGLKEGWVLQELIKVPSENLPWVENDKLKFVKRYININPFILGGKYSGSIMRCSKEEVINVSAGGALGAVCAEK